MYWQSTSCLVRISWMFSCPSTDMPCIQWKVTKQWGSTHKDRRPRHTKATYSWLYLELAGVKSTFWVSKRWTPCWWGLALAEAWWDCGYVCLRTAFVGRVLQFWCLIRWHVTRQTDLWHQQRQDPAKVAGWEEADPHYSHWNGSRNGNSGKECQRDCSAG